MNNIIQPLLMAFTLLTRLPVTRFISSEWSSKHYRYSAYYYPLVGLGIAAVLAAVVLLLPLAISPILQAAIVLCAWVLLTGGLHLDGLADSVDAYFAGHKDSERTLMVLKDPVSGPMAVVAVFLVLILKLAALISLGPSLLVPALLVALVLSRTAALVLLNTTVYARAEQDEGMVTGLASPAGYLTWLVMAVSCMAALLILPLGLGLIAVLAVVLFTYWWRRLWSQIIGGFTGDCLGALIELCEALVLVIVAIVSLY